MRAPQEELAYLKCSREREGGAVGWEPKRLLSCNACEYLGGTTPNQAFWGARHEEKACLGGRLGLAVIRRTINRGSGLCGGWMFCLFKHPNIYSCIRDSNRGDWAPQGCFLISCTWGQISVTQFPLWGDDLGLAEIAEQEALPSVWCPVKNRS